MAITATISLNPSTVTSGVPPGSTATVTISNSAVGGVSVPVLGIRPIVYDSGNQQKDAAVLTGMPSNTGMNGQGGMVPAAGSITSQFQVLPNALREAGVAGADASPATLAFDVTCEIVMGDGSVVIPTAATLTVNPSPHS